MIYTIKKNRVGFIVGMLVCIISFTAISVYAKEIETRKDSNDIGEYIKIKKERNEPPVLEEKVQKRIRNLSSNITNRLNAVIERFEKIITRIQSRINKLANDGIDVTEAIYTLDEARNHLVPARLLLKQQEDTIVAIALSSTPRIDWNINKEHFKKANEELRMAHSSLKETISVLREAIKVVEETSDTATTTQD